MKITQPLGPAAAGASTAASSRRNQLICLGLIVLTVAVYWQVLGFQFTYFDDDVYVSRNPLVLQGLSWDGARWAFTTHWQANWHPLTWLSLMADASIGGKDAGVFHATNVLLHICSTLLLFAILNSLTGLPWRSGVVAALFALHPLHVESVAWVAERKDTLSTLFWMLTMLAYVRYVRTPRLRTYALLLGLFALGLMAKSMLVSLPIVLLMMDYWPLDRFTPGSGRSPDRPEPGWSGVRPLLLEKAPLFVLSAASCAVTLWAQGSGGSIANLEAYPLGVRVANAVVACVGYMGKTIWPLRLAAFYPHPIASLPVWQVIASGALLAGITALAVRFRKRCPYLFVGWLWYVVTLVPVIGLVQVGDQAMADRYTYVPLIGLFIALTWGIADWNRLLQCGGKGGASRLLQVVVGAAIVGLVMLSYAQVGTWRDSTTLFKHAIAVTYWKNNTLAYNNLGYALCERGDTASAIRCYEESLKIRPDSGQAHNGLASALLQANRCKEAAYHSRRAIELGFRRPGVYANLGMALLGSGDCRGALAQLSCALELAPADYRIRYDRALVYARLGMYDEAIRDLKEALSQAPQEHRLARLLQMLEARKTEVPHNE